MAGGDNPDNGGRVTTRELYTELQKQNTDRADMERRIMAKVDCVPSLMTQVNINKEEIDTLRKKSDVWNSLNSLGVMVGTAFSALWKNGG